MVKQGGNRNQPTSQDQDQPQTMEDARGVPTGSVLDHLLALTDGKSSHLPGTSLGVAGVNQGVAGARGGNTLSQFMPTTAPTSATAASISRLRGIQDAGTSSSAGPSVPGLVIGGATGGRSSVSMSYSAAGNRSAALIAAAAAASYAAAPFPAVASSTANNGASGGVPGGANIPPGVTLRSQTRSSLRIQEAVPR